MGLYDCKIIGKSYYSKDQFVFDLMCELVARQCQPGQFVNVLCDGLLRRPISICGVDRENGVFRIAIRIKGSGTAFLEKKQIGDTLSILGPLGHGFNLEGVTNCVVVGGGIGIFPLMFLLQEARIRGIRTISVCGFRSKAQSFCLDELNLLADQTLFASDCGDLDVCGNAIDALKTLKLINETIFTCGPTVMMRAASEFAVENKIPCQVSLEERMGCGTGVCLVCACKIKSGDDVEYKRCCKDGPVFDAREVVWESI